MWNFSTTFNPVQDGWIQLKMDGVFSGFSQEWQNRFGWNFACTNIWTRLDFFIQNFHCSTTFFDKLSQKKPGRAKNFKQKNSSVVQIFVYICACKVSAKSILPFLRKRRPFSTGFIHPGLDRMLWMVWMKMFPKKVSLFP